jgi:hypothetical protein
VLVAILVALAAFVAMPASATAQTTSVTLESSADVVDLGQAVELSGRIAPAASGQSVRVVDQDGAEVATATTAADGSFATEVEPPASSTYHAEWNAVASAEVTVAVRGTVTARLSNVRLFARLRIRGVVDPARAGEVVHVTLVRGGRVVDERDVRTGAAGGYRATFPVATPGRYRARAALASAGPHGGVVTGPESTPLPSLRAGSRGVYVRLLERRLVELDYRLVGTGDGVFDARTADAVVAFHKVQGMARTFTVDAATWRALADPRAPRPERDWRGLHIEVDQTRQVLYVVEDAEIVDILHVSTGKPSTPTRDGVFHVVRKLAGFSPNHLYYPSYFDGNRALHGWTEVPTYAASHGCVRIPYWNAIWVYGIATYGTRVVVYH